VVGSCKTKTAVQSISLTPEEQAILKSLQDKAAKLVTKQPDETSVNTKMGWKSQDQYNKVLRGLWEQ